MLVGIFSSIYEAVAAIVTWDPATVTAVTLSGGDLIATNTGTTSADQGAHVLLTLGKTTGKWYIEQTITTITAGTNLGVGIMTSGSTYSAMGNNATSGNIMFAATGNIWTNGVSSGATLAARASGDVIGIAIDLDNDRVWFKVVSGVPGDWNGSGTADPATNVGGQVIPAGTLVPLAVFGGTGGLAGNVITANFGATAFTGAVPSGFTSGWV